MFFGGQSVELLGVVQGCIAALDSLIEQGWRCWVQSDYCKIPVRVVEFESRVSLLLRNTPLLRTYSRTIPRVLWWS